jgi:hypothetical protein
MNYLIPPTISHLTREQFLAKFSLGENDHEPDNPPLQQQISHLERFLMGLTNHLFDNKTMVEIHKTLYKLLSTNKVIVILLIWSDPFLHMRINPKK